MTDIDQRISEIEKVVNDDIGEGYEYSNLTVEDTVWLISQLREQRSLCDRYREALEEARHSLVTLNGLWATDRGISERRVDAEECGIDTHALPDVMDTEMFQVGEESVLSRIDAALNGDINE